MKLTSKQQQQLVMAVAAVGILGYVYWVYMLTPKRAEIERKQTDLASVNSRIEGLRATASQQDRLRKRVEELTLQVAKVEKRLPRDKNIQDIIRIVSELAARNGVRYASLSPGGESGQQYFTEVPFTLSVSGSVHSLAKFMAALGQEERIMSVKNLSLSAGADARRGQTVTGTFTLYAYIYNG